MAVAPSKYLTTSAIETLKREIREADGAEIFAVLSREEGAPLFDKVSVTCRGTLGEVPALMSRVQPGDMTVHNHPSGVLRPSQADLHIATLFGEEGVGSMIVDNQVTGCFVVAEPSTEHKKVDVGDQEVRAIFENGGVLSKTMDFYECRESQMQMAMDVAKTLNQGRVLSVEAGTGTGKSLAYLVPSMLWVKHNKKRVVIATKTIALQEQLVNKDIPIAQKLIENPPRASLVKGRNNYVCLRKMFDMKDNQLPLLDAKDDANLQREVQDLIRWVEDSGSGDKADLPFVPSSEAWDAVRSDSDMCLGAKCPHFQKSPFYSSRREAARAGILVVNQALLFSDLAVRSISGNYKAAAVIPPYKHIILDEAHGIEDVATDHFGQRLSSLGLRLMLARFMAKAGRSNRGLLVRLSQTAVAAQAKSLLNELEENTAPLFQEYQHSIHEQLQQVAIAFHDAFNPESRRALTVWLKSDMIQSNRLSRVREEAAKLRECLEYLMAVLRKTRRIIEDQSKAFQERAEGLIIEYDARLERMGNTMAVLTEMTSDKKQENKVPWLELKISRFQQPEFNYQVSPLDVSAMLRDSLYKPFDSVTMTSATLDLKDSFSFFSSRAGLQEFTEKPILNVTYPSPFDYRRQAKLIVPRFASDPSSPDFARDLAALIPSVADFIPGGTLVLFTSYKLLNQVADMIRGPLVQRGHELLVQGKASRSFLTQRLALSKGVLLGTDTFWEGIDLAGDALTKVIVTKLPFRQIGDPIFEARCANLEKQGISSFTTYSLPLAMLKFKQGAGRLIRGKRDAGLLFVADNRILTKFYGKKFLTLVESYPLWEFDMNRLQQILLSGKGMASFDDHH